MWIKTEDGLPKKGKDGIGIPVLTIDKYGTMQVATFGEEENCWYNADNVTHWMSLPEEPKNED